MVVLMLALLMAPESQDFDKDGVVDVEDDCPTDSGSAENRGCPGEPPPPAPPSDAPPIQVEGNKLSIEEQIQFRTGSASVDPKSFDLLRRIAETIKGVDPKKRISIEGHTDGQGSRAKNQRLSEQRAQAVVAHMVRHGVDRDRLIPKGFGPDRAIASNDTPAGRARNRRVEFIIVE
jgi:outer membrane protein OmpA-like peptidoglycan-associated protein